MRKLEVILEFLLVLCFAGFFGLTQLGSQGQLESHFLKEILYPLLSRPVDGLTDLKFLFRGTEKPQNRIVVVEIDSPSIEQLGRWPWHRDQMAFLVHQIFSLGAQVVGLDIVFSEPDPRVSPQLKSLLLKKGILDFSEFETDPKLTEVIQLYRSRLVLGWTSDMSCQPFYELPQYCPVTDPEALRLFPPGMSRFALKSQGFSLNPEKTPLISFVTPIANIPEYQKVAQHLGFLNAILDGDGVIRRSHLMVIAQGQAYPSLAVSMAQIGLGEHLQVQWDQKSRVKQMHWVPSGKKIEVNPLSVLQVNFRGPSSSFAHLSALNFFNEADQIEDPAHPDLLGKSKKEILKDAYVLVGLSALGVFDMRSFPFESNTPGVYGHASLLENLLSGDPMSMPSHPAFVLGMILWMTIGIFLLIQWIKRLDAIPALLTLIVIFLIFLWIDFKVLFSLRKNWNTVYLYFEWISLLVMTLALRYIHEEKNKKFLRNAFSKYVSSVVVDSLLKDPTKLALGGEKKELTIMFSDILGFTAFSEKMDAKVLSAFLNDYLGKMTQKVFLFQGTLDKYIGDAIMAFWGAPLKDPTHAWHACQAALQMHQTLAENQERWQQQYGINIDIGIGVHSGVVSVGNMGSEQNFEYTVIGDHVNLASRLEGLSKQYQVPILTTRFTCHSILASGQSLPMHRVLDQVRVKGKQNSIEVIQILEKPYVQEGLAYFEQARQLYQKQAWHSAKEMFLKAQQAFGHRDGPSEVFLQRCSVFSEHPPSANWDGVWLMETK